MELALLGLMVVVGIGVIVGAVYWTDEPASVEAGAMLAAFEADHPQEVAVWWEETADGRALFLVTRTRCNGLVQMFGRRFVTRLFEPGSIDIEADADAGIRITVKDLGWSGGRFAFRTAGQARRVLAAWHGTEFERGVRAA